MPRIRTIKPEFWDDEGVGGLSPMARLLFIATWNLADDAGNLRGAPRLLRLRVFPYDDISDDDVVGLLDELCARGMVAPYVHAGQRYLHVEHFADHQRITRPSGPRFPEPDSSDYVDLHEFLSEPSVSKHAASVSDREGSPRDLDQGKERKGKESAKADDARVVFEHWKSTRRRPGAAKFTDDRRRKVVARLREGYTAEDLCRAIDGMMRTPHNRGVNDRNEEYDDLAVACSSGKNVDRFIKNAERLPEWDDRARTHGSATHNPPPDPSKRMGRK